MKKFSCLFTSCKKLILFGLSMWFFPISLLADEQSLTIGFGSCADQKRQQPIWDVISTHKPKLFILTGDNVYHEGKEGNKFAQSYETFSKNPNFARFRETTPIIATWDDNDYGLNDGGKDYVAKESSKTAFIHFFDYPEVNQLKSKDQGIFHSRWIDFNDKKIQIILLDTRWYRDSLLPTYLTIEQRRLINLGPYQPQLDRSATLLGKEQWQWLEQEFKKPSDFKILVSSIQFLNEYSGWETWSNFPHERRKLLELIHQYSDDNLMIIRGDVHKAEVSEMLYKGRRVVEATSSSLAAHVYPESINIHRLGNALIEKNYGILTFKDNGKLTVVASIYNDKGERKLLAKVGEN